MKERTTVQIDKARESEKATKRDLKGSLYLSVGVSRMLLKVQLSAGEKLHQRCSQDHRADVPFHYQAWVSKAKFSSLFPLFLFYINIILLQTRLFNHYLKFHCHRYDHHQPLILTAEILSNIMKKKGFTKVSDQ